MTHPSEPTLAPWQRVEDPEAMLRALQRAVREALRQHKRDGDPVAVWRDNQVVWIPAEEIPVAMGDDEDR